MKKTLAPIAKALVAALPALLLTATTSSGGLDWKALVAGLLSAGAVYLVPNKTA